MFRQKSSASADRDRSRATAALCQDGHEGAAGLYTADDIQTSDPPPLSQARRTVAMETFAGWQYRRSMGDHIGDHPSVHRVRVRCWFAGLSPS